MNGNGMVDTPYMQTTFQTGYMDGSLEAMTYFNPVHNLFQDMDFTSWDLNFDAFTIPQLTADGPSPQSSITNISKPSSSTRTLARDPSWGHAAFRRSPWIWDPESKDYLSREKEGLQLNEEPISNYPSLETYRNKIPPKAQLNNVTRDRLFAMVVGEIKDQTRAPSFPSVDLLNYLIQAHFVQEDHEYDSWLHFPTFRPDDTLTELVGAVIASGATFISTPSIWQFGYAMQEIVRLRMGRLVCDESCLTSFLIFLGICSSLG
jgi:hypothetical protein